MDIQPPPAADLQADFPFDYAAHLAGGRRAGRLPENARGAPVAVIGAGGSGLAAAYELMRAGCRPVVYEAESSPDGPGGRRLGGRMYSRRLDAADSAVVELGCMRFPDSARLLRQYAEDFGLHWEPFRENYAAGTTPVTVWDVDGRSHAVEQITDLYPLDETFRRAHLRWQEALTRTGLHQIQRDIARRDLTAVRRRWQDIVHRYEQWTFYRFLRDADGVGLGHDEARLLGTAGIGPAAWDCFFGLSAVEILRLLLVSEGGTQCYPREGISALADGFWAHRTTGPDGRETSLEEINGGAPRPAVTVLEVEDDAARGVTVHSADGHRERFAAAVFTPQLHLLETGVELRSTPSGASPLGPRLWRAVRRLSYWQSAKTALVLDAPFWEGTSMDGVTLTDRLPRASYTLDYGPPRGEGGRRAVLDLSFTWSQDAMKVSASSLEERVALFVRDLARIHPDAATTLRQQAEQAQAVTVSWENEPHFRGLCRFACPGEFPYQRDLFSHFMKDFTGTRAVPGEPPNALFLAGDDTSWSPGWLEHALASGINAAWGVLRLLGGQPEPGNPGPGDVWDRPEYSPITPPA
ncbi:FAD-dependent oxidoreductase [Streptomyces sp. TRM 70351]|uniref:flavin monoamine oxidase family protein n=1 Tax=Streptomyces sp. TRM 70351 TaxID=3116552 RepID=UPI002E7BFD47|nr:FAD-dependent oxidoreductase [Streptomyces sp. TRM 70351]MEE1928275.1 FAD-dependent oxidoreductase [Streptomyces sp. TRM 70351]